MFANNNWIHCNKCGDLKRMKSYEFLLASCYHIFCIKCLHATAPHCPVCNNNSKIMPINEQMPHGCKMLFNPKPELDTSSLKRVFSFQKLHRENLRKMNLLREDDLPKLEYDCNRLYQALQQMRMFGESLDEAIAAQDATIKRELRETFELGQKLHAMKNLTRRRSNTDVPMDLSAHSRQN